MMTSVNNMPIFCEVVVLLRPSRPIRAEAWLSHGKNGSLTASVFDFNVAQLIC